MDVSSKVRPKCGVLVIIEMASQKSPDELAGLAFCTVAVSEQTGETVLCAKSIVFIDETDDYLAIFVAAVLRPGDQDNLLIKRSSRVFL
jgi:hypothetical protein